MHVGTAESKDLPVNALAKDASCLRLYNADCISLAYESLPSVAT